MIKDKRTVGSGQHGWTIAAFALAAVVVAFVGGATWGSKAPPAWAELIDEAADYHQIYSRETKHLVEVAADQVDELTAWLGERVGRDIKVPDLGAAGLRFVGGRMQVISERPVATLMYTRAEGLPIAFCISRISAADKSISIQQRDPQRVAFWITRGYAYLVVGEIDGPTAENLAALAAAQIES